MLNQTVITWTYSDANAEIHEIVVPIEHRYAQQVFAQVLAQQFHDTGFWVGIAKDLEKKRNVALAEARSGDLGTETTLTRLARAIEACNDTAEQLQEYAEIYLAAVKAYEAVSGRKFQMRARQTQAPALTETDAKKLAAMADKLLASDQPKKKASRKKVTRKSAA